MDIMLRLREATADLHTRIEQLPFAVAMIGARLTREQYVLALGQLWYVHDALESEIVEHPALGCVYEPAMARRAAIERDLTALGAAGPASEGPPTRALADAIRRWSAERPQALLGSLYIFEGSRMGSMVLVKPLARSLGVPVEAGRGLDYHLEEMAGRLQAWGRFKAAMLAAPLTAEDHDGIVASGVATMQGLYDVYAALTVPTLSPAVARGRGGRDEGHTVGGAVATPPSSIPASAGV